MIERFNYSKRIIFKKGRQAGFISLAEKKLGIDSKDFMRIFGVDRKTVEYWKKEKGSMPLAVVQYLSKRSSVSLPKDVEIRDRYWYVHEGGKKGAATVMRKYGRFPVDPQYRKERWQKWWDKKGKFNLNAILIPLPFRKPKPSVELAEFFGILMGDGGTTMRQISITLHHIDDLDYSYFVRKLMKALFNVDPSVTHRIKSSTNTLLISRSDLVKYLHSLGIVIGNKIEQQLDIPQWIKNNNRFLKACIRGLVDTDGCVFINNYEVNGKWYSYKKIDFTSASKPLRESVLSILRDLGLTPSASGIHVRLNSKSDVEKYFKLVGSHNPKHLNKYGAKI